MTKRPNVIYRQVGVAMPVITHGVGCRVFTGNGRTWLDMSSSCACATLGHSNHHVIDAINRQAEMIPNAFSGFWASESSERAGQILRDEFEALKPGWFGGVIFHQGGGETMDLCCRLAAQYHLEIGDQRTYIATRKHSYHGVNLIPAAISGNYPRFKLMEPYVSIASNYNLRLEHPIDFNNENHILAHTRQMLEGTPITAAVIIEPVGGPPIGAWPDTQSYLQGLRQICDDTGTLLVYDEILCGSGRCGSLTVAALRDVWPDIIVLGKGLTSGYQPVTAICVSRKVADRIQQNSGVLSFGTAHAAHSMGCAAVAATLEYIREHDLYQHVRTNGVHLYHVLKDALLALPIVGNIRGDGYLWGVCLGRKDGSTFDPKLQLHMQARKAIADAGAIVFSKGGTMHGRGDFLLVAPPLIMTNDELLEGVTKIRQGLIDVCTRLGLDKHAKDAHTEPAVPGKQ